MHGASLAVLGVLLQTLIHVSLFTLVFMMLGAYRSGTKVQWMLVAFYVAAIVLILVAPPSAATLIPSFAKAGQAYFANVSRQALGRLLDGLRLDTRMTSLLAFLYTYHYLNWFIKADIIRWNQMTKERLTLVVAASAFTALYFYDYALGFTVLLAFSLAHIVLEFPLNGLALRQFGEAIGGSVAKAVQRAWSMLFPSITFLFSHFLPLFVIAYCEAPGITTKNIVLVTASLLFYAWDEPLFVLLLAGNIVFNYAAALLIGSVADGRRRTATARAIAANLAIL